MERRRWLILMSVAAGLAVPAGGAAWAQPAPPPLPPPPLPPPPPPPPGYSPYAVPGPTYYPAPGTPAAPDAPPPVLPYWEPGNPIPQGYKPVSKPTAGLLGMGIGILSAGWTTAAVVGAVAQAGASQTPGGNPGAWVPMYFPVVGPFLTMAILQPGPAEVGLLLSDGIFQIAGTVGVLVGSLKRTYRLVYTGETASIELTPAAGPGFWGLRTTALF
jgi:hypothetical protein